MITIAALNYWRGRGYDAPIKLPKWAFFIALYFYNYTVGTYLFGSPAALEIANQLAALFALLFAVGTGGMMQALHGEKQDKPEFYPIDWVLANILKLNTTGKLYGVAFCTTFGLLQALVLTTFFGFSLAYFSLLLLGVVVYYSKHWHYAEINMALLWAATVILLKFIT